MKRTIYSTKYALTQGIQVYENCLPGYAQSDSEAHRNGLERDPDSKWWYTGSGMQLEIGKTGFFTREDAEKRAELLCQRKIKNLQKQIDALIATDFSK